MMQSGVWWWCGAPLPPPIPGRDLAGWVAVHSPGPDARDQLGEPAREMHPVLVGESGTRLSVEQVKNGLEKKGERGKKERKKKKRRNCASSFISDSGAKLPRAPAFPSC